MEVTRQEQESDTVEDAQVNFRRGTERYVPGRTWNLRYAVTIEMSPEPLFTLALGFFPPLHALQFLLSMTHALGALFGTSISITSEQSECADLLRKVFPRALLPQKGLSSF